MIASLIEAALRSLLMALAVWAILRLFRVRNVLAQKAAWGGVLAAAMLMPLLVPMAARWPVLPAATGVVLPANPMTLLEELRATLESRRATVRRPPQTAATAPQASSPQIEDSAAPEPDNASSRRAPMPTESSADGARPAEYAQPLADSGHPSFSLATLALLFYFAVALALLCRLFYGLGSALRLWRDAQPVFIVDMVDAKVPLRSSGAIFSPVTIGSSVVLPDNYTEWDSEKLRIVLAHERCHIRQGDFYLQLLAGFYTALFWFSPLGWWLKRKLSDLAEAISDRAALSEAASRPAYAQILIEFAAAPRPTLIGVAMARPGSLSQRVERLLNDNTFRQAFAGTRRRALLAVLLVPVALFVCTALIRVQAAGQAPQEPAPAAKPAPSAQPAAPATGQANPDQVTKPDAAPTSDQAEPAPPADVVPPAPPNTVAPVPPIGPAPDVVPPPSVDFPPAPDTPPPPPAGIGMGRGEGRGYFFSQDQRNSAGAGHGYAYSMSSNGDSWVLSSGSSDNVRWSGDWNGGRAEDLKKAAKLAHGKFLWFSHDGKSYFVDDPAIVAQIEDMYKPMQALGKEQEALGRQQEALGKQQEAIGRQQLQVSVPTPDISREKARLDAAMVKMQAEIGKTVTQEVLANLQGELAKLQGELGALQGEMGSRMGAFGDQQGKLGAEQGKLGAEQGRLGAEQGRLAQETDRRVKSIIGDALKNGMAKPVQ
ncbi:MAG: M56 family metallopeptidase [Terracidiphilus sp.]